MDELWADESFNFIRAYLIQSTFKLYVSDIFRMGMFCSTAWSICMVQIEYIYDRHICIRVIRVLVYLRGAIVGTHHMDA